MREALSPLRHALRSFPVQFLAFLAGWALYIALFILLFDVLGAQVGALVILPVALTAGLWGLRAGLLAGLASFGLNTFLFNFIQPALGGWDAVLNQGGGIGHAVTAVLGGAVGYLRDTRALLARQKKRILVQQKQLLHLAHHDVLTGLPNRALFMDRLEQAVAQAKRSGDTVAVCFLDLNGFKEVNDTLGHAAGDELLKQVAARLQARCRKSDTLARIGGDEFTVIAAGLRDMGSARRVADVLTDALHTPFTLAGQEVNVSASMGLSLYPQDGRSADDLLRRADSAMYRVKRRKMEHDPRSYVTLF